MTKKLHYFDLPGIGESIRYIFHYAGHKFEDIRYDITDWPVKSIKDSFPYGQLPLYEEGGRSLNQSIAIARYLASQAGLLPADPWEQALLDAAVLTIYDFWNKVLEYFREPDPVKKEVLKNTLFEENIEYFFSRFEKELTANKGYFNGKLSWADFILVGIVEASNAILDAEIEKKYPHIVKLGEKIRSLPGVKEYVAKKKQ